MFRTALISMFITSTALATTWTVDDDGKADFNNIQAAVDAASDGDEIVVMPGTYTSTQDGHVVNMLGKAITLRSSNPDDPEIIASTIIDGQNSRRGIACFSGETLHTRIWGLTITHGNSPYMDYDNNGVLDWYEGAGGGIYCLSSEPTVTGCHIVDNFAFIAGGIYCALSNNPLIETTLIESNRANYGGGIACYLSHPLLTRVVFRSNSALKNGGGGLHCFGSNPTIEKSSFFDNTANTNGGGLYCVVADPLLTDCLFEQNTATDEGGGIFASASYPSIVKCTLTLNAALYRGGGISEDYYGNPFISETIICNNTPNQLYGDWTDNGGNSIAEICSIDCPDVNGDGYVNVTDLLAIIDQWGLTNSPADVNADGIVDVSDLLIVIGNWGECE